MICSGFLPFNSSTNLSNSDSSFDSSFVSLISGSVSSFFCCGSVILYTYDSMSEFSRRGKRSCGGERARVETPNHSRAPLTV